MSTLVRLIFLLFASLFTTAEALACQCDIGTVDENFEESVAAFHIRVTATALRSSSEFDFSDAISAQQITEDEIAEFIEDVPEYVRVSFEVIEVYKGESKIPSHLNELTLLPGNCGLGLITGVEFVIFLSGEPMEFASFCTGSFGFFNPEATKVKPKLDRLRELSN